MQSVSHNPSPSKNFTALFSRTRFQLLTFLPASQHVWIKMYLTQNWYHLLCQFIDMKQFYISSNIISLEHILGNIQLVWLHILHACMNGLKNISLIGSSSYIFTPYSFLYFLKLLSTQTVAFLTTETYFHSSSGSKSLISASIPVRTHSSF